MLGEKELIRESYADGVLRVAITGEIDHHSAKPLRERIDKEIYRYHPRELVLSFDGVSFMDSSGLGLVLGRLALCRHFGGRVRIVGATERTRRIFALSGMERIEDLTVEGLCEKERMV